MASWDRDIDALERMALLLARAARQAWALNEQAAPGPPGEATAARAHALLLGAWAATVAQCTTQLRGCMQSLQQGRRPPLEFPVVAGVQWPSWEELAEMAVPAGSAAGSGAAAAGARRERSRSPRPCRHGRVAAAEAGAAGMPAQIAEGAEASQAAPIGEQEGDQGLSNHEAQTAVVVSPSSDEEGDT